VRNALWAVALAAALIWDYRDKNAPGHDSLVYGTHVYATRPGYLILLVIGGLGFWFGMKALTGR
jgi:hypothetical protein